VNQLFSCQTNLALFQTGTLLDSMFTFPQSEGTAGLLMSKRWCATWPEEASNLYLKLGMVGESQHWAHEAFEQKGPTPHILKRLGTLYMLKGNYEAAKKFFSNLENVPFYKASAENLIRLDENPSRLAQDTTFAEIRSKMPADDFVSLGEPSPDKLRLLLKRNPENKMAFEYLIAYELLAGDLKAVWSHMPDFVALGYPRLPRHVQEAVVFGAALDPKSDPTRLANLIRQPVFGRFMEFRKAFSAYRNNAHIAKQELRKQFGDTYWYYLTLARSSSRQVESEDEYH
jgi:hypothetical protein